MCVDVCRRDVVPPNHAECGHNVLGARVSTQDFGTMEEPLPGRIARAATPAAVAAAMPRSGGAEQRRGDIASLAYVAEVEGAA
jgi:hypothetical protein